MEGNAVSENEPITRAILKTLGEFRGRFDTIDRKLDAIAKAVGVEIPDAADEGAARRASEERHVISEPTYDPKTGSYV